MAAPRFSPVRRVLLAVVVVYATAAALTVWLGSSLRFAASRLPSYLTGSIAVPEHTAWEDEAAELLDSGQDLDRAKVLLEQALAVEPNASTHFLLGEVLRAQGNPGEALVHYHTSIALDPARAEPYLRTAKLLFEAGDAVGATRVLGEGTAAIERALQRQVPVPDATVRDVFNKKATEEYDDLTAGLASLNTAARNLR
jgi:cytochrome c-type biogenesis protein CcmH/NrfG